MTHTANALDHLWEVGLSHLSEHVSAVGHPWVEGTRCADGFDLELWVEVLHTWWVEDRLRADQRAALAAVPGWTVMMDMAEVGGVLIEHNTG